ncbi:hypothetical protein EYF80_055695 [Liparis tanakae]|uniref:Uncharacterized protein n=1 Tax=Liparis tanakae TaxID=230148 RepID=A0A4Z2F043_9TELE|nr:hypothetical protein EYF80_055695 [Liparis tanakae]
MPVSPPHSADSSHIVFELKPTGQIRSDHGSRPPDAAYNRGGASGTRLALSGSPASRFNTHSLSSAAFHMYSSVTREASGAEECRAPCRVNGNRLAQLRAHCSLPGALGGLDIFLVGGSSRRRPARGAAGSMFAFPPLSKATFTSGPEEEEGKRHLDVGGPRRAALL